MDFLSIRYPKTAETFYHGRNGTGYCVGLEVYGFRKTYITVNPINTKGVANCSIDIPKDIDTLQTLINYLREVQSEIERGKHADAA